MYNLFKQNSLTYSQDAIYWLINVILQSNGPVSGDLNLA